MTSRNSNEEEFKRKDIELGISDGLNVEVKNGLAFDDEVKIWNKLIESNPK